MAAFLFDTFTAADGTGVVSRAGETGATWTSQIGGTAPVISSNRARANAFSDQVILTASGTPPSPDYYVEAVVRPVTVAEYAGLILRFQDSANYYLLWFRTAGFTFLYPSVLSRDAAFTWVAGTDYTVRFSISGTVGAIVLTVSVDGIVIDTFTHLSGTGVSTASLAALYFRDGSASAGFHFASVTGDVPATNAITFTDVVNYRVVQRSGTTGSLALSGTHTGATSVQARVVEFGTSTEVVTWTTIDAAPGGSTWSGTLTGIPQGSWYSVQVRQGNDTGIVSNGVNRFGVGCLFAVIGQSQGVHWFSDGTAITPDSALVQYSGSAGTDWAVRTTTGNGPNAFGNSMRTALGGTIPVAMLSYAVGSTALVAAGGGSDYWANPGSPHPYNAFITGVNSVGGKLEGAIWMQGEQDGYSTAVSEATYATALATLFALIRTDLGQSTLPIIVSPLANYTNAGPTDASWEGIRRAQITVGLQTNNTLAAPNQDLVLDDGVHYNAAAYTIHGTRAARAARSALGLSAYARGPAIASAVRVDSTTVDVTLTHRGGTDFTPTTGITGFQVIVSGSPVTLNSVVRSSATVIRITLAAPLSSGAGTLRYQYGTQPTVTAPVLDNTTETLSIGIESAVAININESDVTAPILTSPTGTQTGSTTASGTVSTDEASGTLYRLASINSTESAATVKAAGLTQVVSSSGVQNVTFTGLAASTTYYAHYVHTDVANNDSSRVSSSSFITAAEAPPATSTSLAGLRPLFDMLRAVS